jgi:hypothetical protein
VSALLALLALAVLWLAVVGILSLVGRHREPEVEFMSPGWVIDAYRHEHVQGGLR